MSELTSTFSAGEIAARSYELLGRADAGGMGVVCQTRAAT